MAKDTLHELHHRRAGRNLGLLVVLVALVVIVFGLAMIKIGQGDMMEAFDHQPRASMLPRDPDARPAAPTVTAPATQPGTGTAGAPTPTETEVSP